MQQEEIGHLRHGGGVLDLPHQREDQRPVSPRAREGARELRVVDGRQGRMGDACDGRAVRAAEGREVGLLVQRSAAREVRGVVADPSEEQGRGRPRARLQACVPHVLPDQRASSPRAEAHVAVLDLDGWRGLGAARRDVMIEHGGDRQVVGDDRVRELGLGVHEEHPREAIAIEGQVVLQLQVEFLHQRQVLGSMDDADRGDHWLVIEGLGEQQPQALAGPEGIGVGSAVGQDEEAAPGSSGAARLTRERAPPAAARPGAARRRTHRLPAW